MNKQLQKKDHIPVYGLNEFRTQKQRNKMYQVEVFDAHRHFEVSYPHKHDFYEILFLTAGAGYHIIDSNKYEIIPHCVFFMSPGQAHKLELSNDIDGYIFLFTAEFYLLSQTNKNRILELPFFYSVEHLNPPLLLNNKADTDFLKALFIRIIEKTAGNESFIQSMLDVILQTCYDLYPQANKGIQKNKGHIIVKKLVQLVDENFHKNLSINQYASLLSITPNHLTYLVKQVTGNSSAKLLQNKMIVETKRLLMHTNMTVTQIADYLSFSDQSYFTKYFKKATGYTPIQYRNKNR